MYLATRDEASAANLEHNISFSPKLSIITC